ncbi:TetR/AcrR family transcriptional regulator C-terminal domain-containing protein [Actinophytocola oryzae]|uniref:TetR family transcriptional regulator n=1 Tax=Actinophytocola oryzae TaxID=502181 RepID=A0A4R7V8Z3_9PSEU|nr:TetR/AcrR family transcriptional regulator C-terminal domain-containing protein [Actinophytocola oryzae]TDV45382.1 TetR family transcriptional regulator [Actinophytocola oryzae]
MADSAEILAGIRRRIASGELAPGDRVPSTRQITRQWGVAMATATRVLTTLRQEGLVVARPGIGTVVASTAPAVTVTPRPRATHTEVTREDVVRTAMAIADAEGSPALSMRRVATALGVATMSLYRHVPSKDELVERMIDTVFADHRFDTPPPRDWLAAVEAGARRLWVIFRAHPWVAAVMSLTRPQVTPNVLAYSEWVMSALQAAGLGTRPIFQVHLTMFSYVRGLAVSLEPEVVAEQETGLTYDEFIDTRGEAITSVIASGAFPTFQAVAASADFDLDLDEQFDFGLRHLLAGLAGLPLADG